MRVIILAGGIGKRLWPLSSNNTPKQFIKQADGLSSFQQTLQRNKQFSDPFIVTNKAFFDIAKRQMAEVGVYGYFLLEQNRCGTAFAVLISLLHCQYTGSEQALILPADHSISMHEEYINDIQTLSITGAKQKAISMLAITPHYNPSAYGCFTVQKRGSSPWMRVKSFIEKPNKEQLTSLSKDCFYVNSGIYCLPVAETIELFFRLLHEYSQDINAIYKSALRSKKTICEPIKLADSKQSTLMRELSFDKAIIQQASKLIALPANFCWQDLGNWQNLLKINEDKASSNSLYGEIETCNVENTIIHAKGFKTCVIGVKNLVIIAKENKLLVTHKDEANKIKDMI